MKAVLSLELIGDDLRQYQRLRQAGRVTRPLHWKEELRAIQYDRPDLRPWVSRLLGLGEHYGYRREFIRQHTKDYRRANRTGSRGVYAYYVLEPGIYEINDRTSWNNARRYFARVEGATLTEIDEAEVRRCLANAS